MKVFFESHYVTVLLLARLAVVMSSSPTGLEICDRLRQQKESVRVIGPYSTDQLLLITNMGNVILASDHQLEDISTTKRLILRISSDDEEERQKIDLGEFNFDSK